MRIIFAGTPSFAASALSALIDARHEIALVLTQPDRPAGRGLKLLPSAVKEVALEHGLPIAQPTSLKAEAIQQQLQALQVDVMVVAAYGLILPQAVLDISRFGAINIHASLLPRWRGAAPIQRAILAGDVETGITIMQMDAGLDTGYMLERHVLSILSNDTMGSLHDRLALLGAEAIVDALARLQRGELVGTPQPDVGVTYAAKIKNEEAQIDWRSDAAAIERQVRALNPTPVASTSWQAEALRVWRAELAAQQGEPGRVLAVDSQGVLVACGSASVRLLEVQRAGKQRMTAAQWAQGARLAPGAQLG